MAQLRLNFKGVTTLVVDRDHYTRGLISQMLRSFGVLSIASLDNGEAAKAHMKTNYVDLCIIEANLPDMTGSDLIRWVRREQKEPLRFVPILVLSGYTQLKMISATRDAGANIVLKKPLSAQALFDRVAWLARTPRSYIEAGDYVGPDRRFRNIIPRDEKYKRSTDYGEAPKADNNPVETTKELSRSIS